MKADHEVPLNLINMWKKYRIATFGSDEAWKEINEFTELYVVVVLRQFGKAFIQMGNEIWKAQADELETSSWVKVSLQTKMCGSGSQQEEEVSGT
ncbi:hypothetical protein NW768_005984 [Fusarium equiseti]|uniref:Uncharacterized protein n=1 Tax=Fusarium equiseti TaxID=61235 RepID=A0ABQ8RDQ3_FUSEQ|nr:hypothetical protein NW768_005984 [Fusarium equiseti]